MLTIKDFRAFPCPPEFPVIKEPGNFAGWCLTVELSDKSIHHVSILRVDTPEVVAAKLRALAGGLEQCQALAMGTEENGSSL